MTRFLKDCLVALLDFLDSWDSRRIARDQELVRLQQRNHDLWSSLQVAKAELEEARRTIRYVYWTGDTPDAKQP